MNMSPLDLALLNQERMRELRRLESYRVYDEFNAAPEESVVTRLTSQVKQWFQNRQFRGGSARRRAHAAV